jgi:hypothetical protein
MGATKCCEAYHRGSVRHLVGGGAADIGGPPGFGGGPLREAEEEDGRLDDLLARITKKQVVKVRYQLNGREFGSMDEVDSALGELRERLPARLGGVG